MPYGAILLSESIRHHRRFKISRRYANGVIVGQADPPSGARSHIAITVDVVKATRALHPVVAEFRPGGNNWIFPEDPQKWARPESLRDLASWLRELRGRPRLEWLRRLKAHIQACDWVKVAIEGYSLPDLRALSSRGWFVGRSAHAPLWRLYGQIPVDDYEGELPAFDGNMRSLDRFGAIFDHRRHQIALK